MEDYSIPWNSIVPIFTLIVLVIIVIVIVRDFKKVRKRERAFTERLCNEIDEEGERVKRAIETLKEEVDKISW